jgi:flagellar basal body rod protein FlgG
MSDRTFEIGGAALESAEERFRKLMDNMVGSEIPGYKKSEVVVRGFELALDKAEKKLGLTKPQVEGSHLNTSQGALIRTGNKLDLALATNGYFVIAGPWGEGLTRDGRFQLDKDGRLLTSSGNFPVLGRGGPIIVPAGADVEFNNQGDLKVKGEVIDRLRVVMPVNQDQLNNLNGTIFQVKDSASALNEVDEPSVVQGFIESSNVNVIEQMMEMIEGERYFNFTTKMVANRDQNLTKAMDLGRVQ